MNDRIDDAVNKALEKEPAYELTHGFTDRVMSMIQRKLAEKEAKRDRLWLILGIASMIIVFIYAFTAVGFKPNVGVFTFLSGYKGLIAFGILFVITLNVVDKRLLKHK